jgi:hypothetical protein
LPEAKKDLLRDVIGGLGAREKAKALGFDRREEARVSALEVLQSAR